MQYPCPGWTDSKGTTNAFSVLYGSGVLHTVPFKPNYKIDVVSRRKQMFVQRKPSHISPSTCPCQVPCDYVANRVLCASYRKMDVAGTVPIVHATAGWDHSMTTIEMVKAISSFFNARPHIHFKPFLRVAGESSDPRVKASFWLDRLRLRVLPSPLLSQNSCL